MTTAHRPTWKPAYGLSDSVGKGYVPTRSYSARVIQSPNSGFAWLSEVEGAPMGARFNRRTKGKRFQSRTHQTIIISKKEKKWRG